MLIDEDGLGMCLVCAEENEASREKEAQQGMLAGRLRALNMKGRLDNLIRSEQQRAKRSDDTSEMKRIKSECLQAVAKHILSVQDANETKCTDVYSKVVRSDRRPGTLEPALYRDPMMPSIEAVFSYVYHEGKLGCHVPNNVKLAGPHLNLFKNHFSPAVLALVSAWVKLKPKERDDTTTEALIDEMNTLHEICVKTPYRKIARLQQDVSKEEYSMVRQECIENRHRDSVTENPNSQAYQYADAKEGWKPREWKRIMRLVEQMEEKFGGKKLARGKDGCPYPFHPHGMPEDWSWETSYKLYALRLHRPHLVVQSILGDSRQRGDLIP